MITFLLILFLVIFVVARIIENRGGKGLPVLKQIVNAKQLIVSWLVQLLSLSIVLFIIIFLIFF